MSITRRLIGTERRAAGPWGTEDVIPPPGGGGIGLGSNAAVSETSALSIMTVLACAGLLSDAVSTLPIDAFKRIPDGRQEIKPKPSLIDHPFNEITTQDWLAQATFSMALRGNFYGIKADFDRLMFPRQIQPLHPDMVKVRFDRASGEREYTVNGMKYGRQEIFHVPYITIPGTLQGINPVEYCRQGLRLAIAAEASGTKFFENGTLASGTIEAPYDLSPEQARALAQSWAEAHQGIGKAHLPAVLTGGAKWSQLSVNPDDAQFLQTRGFQRAEIAMMFRVPPHMIGDVDRTTSWGTGIEQQEQGFVTNTLTGYTGRLEAALSDLIPNQNSYVKFNFRGRLRGDTVQRFQAYTMGRNIGVYNADEIRALEDMPPLPDGKGQEYYGPLNFAPLAQGPAAPLPSGSEGVTGSLSASRDIEEMVRGFVQRELHATNGSKR